MTGFLAILGLAGLGIWILGPLRSSRRQAHVEDARWKELVDAKHAVYRSILDLEFDQSVGKVSEADYRFLRRQHETEALEILGQLDALAASVSGRPAPEARHPDDLEDEIAAARRRLHAGG